MMLPYNMSSIALAYLEINLTLTTRVVWTCTSTRLRLHYCAKR